MSENKDELLRDMAKAHAAAYARMVELGGGIGLLGVKYPRMYQDILAWDDLTENDHADTVLYLLERIAVLEEAGESNE